MGRTRRAITDAVLILLLALFALPPLLAPRNFPSDDSLFYLQVARNIAAGHGSTFNQIHPTNGYHPLWMGPCVVAAWLSGGSPIPMLRIVFLMQIALAAGCLLLFRALSLRLGIRWWPIGLPILATFFLTGMYGSEAHLNGFLVLASFVLLERVHALARPRDEALLGVLLGLAVLARLDNVFLAAAVVTGVALATPARGRARAAVALRVVAPMILVLLPYLAWNVARFGHLVPISGAIKSTFPRVNGDLRNLGALGLAVCVAAVIGAVAALLGAARGARRLLVGTLSAGVLAQCLYIVLFTNHNTHWSWYYVPGVLLATLLGCTVADAVSERSALFRRGVVPAALIALLTLAGLARGWARSRNSAASSHNQFVLRFLPPATQDRWEIQFARAMERALPPRTAVLVFDYPGHLAFYSSLRIVAADGLMADYDCDRELSLHGLRRYLADHGIDYYVGEGLDPPDMGRDETLFAPLERLDVGALALSPEDVVMTTASVVRGAPMPDVALFRIRAVLPPRGSRPPPVVKHGALW